MKRLEKVSRTGSLEASRSSLHSNKKIRNEDHAYEVKKQMEDNMQKRTLSILSKQNQKQEKIQRFKEEQSFRNQLKREEE